MSKKTTLRDKVRIALRGKDERLLIETGFVHPSGALTLEGRKVVLDLLFEDPELRAKVIELATVVKKDVCAEKKEK